jgi:putative endonuclease
MYHVYIIESQKDFGWYIGFTSDLRRRFEEHNQHKNISTSSRGSFKLIYYEAYLDKRDTLGREKFLKSGAGRKFLKKQMKHYLEEKENRK